jgi:hypothetical protein
MWSVSGNCGFVQSMCAIFAFTRETVTAVCIFVTCYKYEYDGIEKRLTLRGGCERYTRDEMSIELPAILSVGYT